MRHKLCFFCLQDNIIFTFLFFGNTVIFASDFPQLQYLSAVCTKLVLIGIPVKTAVDIISYNFILHIRFPIRYHSVRFHNLIIYRNSHLDYRFSIHNIFTSIRSFDGLYFFHRNAPAIAAIPSMINNRIINPTRLFRLRFVCAFLAAGRAACFF